MFKYSQSKYSYPEISLQARSPVDPSLSEEIQALVDTGAFMTCVPEKVIDKLGGALEYRETLVGGAIGRSTRRVYTVHLKIAKCEFLDHEVIALDLPYAVIGRDILNEYKITFDGPNKTWEVHADCD